MRLRACTIGGVPAAPPLRGDNEEVPGLLTQLENIAASLQIASIRVEVMNDLRFVAQAIRGEIRDLRR